MKFKKILSGVLAFATIFTAGFVPIIADEIFPIFRTYITANAKKEESTEPYFKINNLLLKVGEGISVSSKNIDIPLILKWYVGEENETGKISYTSADENKINETLYIPDSDDYEKWIKVEAYNNELELIYSDSVYFSKLPVIYINTDDGQAVTSKEEYKSAAMSVQNNDVCTLTEYNKAIQIKGRGNSTWSWPKKPYKIKLDSKTDMFGMGQNKHWVLLANYLDESLIRNTTAFNISEQLGLETMNSVWVDVVLNDSYIGNYQFCEHIRIDEERVDIFNWEDKAEDVASAVYKAYKNTIFTKEDKSNLEDLLKNDLSWVTSGEFNYNGNTYTVSDYYDLDSDISGGYLFELSDEYDELSKFTTENELKVMVNSPEYLYTNPEMMDYVKQFWQNFENAYRSENGYVNIDGKDYHYSELADIDSMVSYWLVMEIMGNCDSSYKSRYTYKDKGLLLKFGPVWDFDWGCGSWILESTPGRSHASGWKITTMNFYKEFADDPLFICKATEKYWEIHDYLVSLVNEDGIIDNWYNYLIESGEADELRWPRSVSWPERPVNQCGFVNSFETFKKEFLAKRIEWLDEQFSSDLKLLKSVYCNRSANPYIKSDDMLEISVLNGVHDDLTLNAPADYIVGNANALNMSVNVNDNDTLNIEIYVNGLYCETVPVSYEHKADITIDNEYLTENDVKKNVISLIAKNSTGDTTYRNFTTVIKETDHIDSDNNNICDRCGSIIEKTVAKLNGYSLSLSGNIGVNFYMELDQSIIDDENAYMHFKLPNGTTSDVKISEAAKKTIDEKECYVFSCGVSAKEMTSNIEAQMMVNEAPVSTEYIYTVKEYADSIINSTDSKYADTVPMVKAMLNYGGYSQEYFNYKTDSLAYDGISIDMSDVSVDSAFEVTGSTNELKYVGTSLLLKSNTVIRHYFKLSDKNNIDDFDFKNGEISIIPKEKDNLYYIDIENISAKNLDTPFIVSAGNIKIKYCVNDYIADILSSDNSDGNLRNVVKALYLYGNTAKTYFSTQS